MRLKTFTAKTMSEAMAQVRAALGPDAIIVSSRSGGKGGGVRVTAALEGDAPAPVRASKPVRPKPAAGARLADLVAEAEDLAYEQSLDRLGTVLDHHNLPAAIKTALMRISHSVEAESAHMALAAAFDGEFTFRPLSDSFSGPLVLVGQPGAGKTVTVAKIAAEAVLAGKTVKLVTADTVRSGGVDQLKGFAKLIKLDVTAAGSPGELSDAVTDAGHDLVLVDTPGCNPFSSEELDHTARIIEAAGGEAVLIATAGGDCADAGEAGEIFSALGCRRMIATRLDTARRYGSILACAAGGKLAFAGASATPYVAEGIQPLNPVSLARLMTARPKSSPAKTVKTSGTERKRVTS